jgi:outer membrane protein TolC
LRFRKVGLACLACLATSWTLGATGTQAMTLEEVLAIARRNAPALQEAEASLRRADQAIREARAAQAPRLDLNANYIQNSEEPRVVFDIPGASRQTVSIGKANTLDVRADAGYPLYTGGRTQALVGAARAAREGQRLGREQAEADLVLRVSQAFYRAIAAQRQERAAVEAVDYARAHLHISAARVRAGVVQRVDSLRAAVDLSQRDTGLLRARQAAHLARVDLETAIGAPLDPGRTLVEPGVPDPAPADSSGLMEAARRERLELKQLDESVRELDARIVAARAGRRPQLRLTATAEYLGPNIEGDYVELDVPGLKTYKLFAGVGLSMPLLDGGLTSARVGQLEADRAALEARRRDAELAVRRDVERAWSDLKVAESLWLSDSSRVTAAREALRLAEAGYKGGTSTATDVRDAEAALADARAQEARSLMDAWIARAGLEHAAGVTPRRGD